MDHFLPEELLHIVLSKLDVKSLLRLRCVSKLWLNIIDSSYFINMHLTETVKTCSNTIIVPYDFKEYNKSMPMYAFEFDNKNKARKIDPPVAGYGIDYVHTCNGLISLSTGNSFVIWNPATHKHRVVEKVIVDDKEGRRPYNGFGYDQKTGDYKVVMFEKQLKEGKKCYIVHIYSLKTGSWRKTGTTNNEIMGNLRLSVYANGAIHWIHSSVVTPEPILEMERKMVAFDLTTETWLPLTMPPKQSEKSATNESWSLINHHGSLYASCCDDETLILDLWAMNYHQGTKINTWTKLFTWKGKGSLCYIVTPLWSLKKTSRCQVLVHDTHELQLFDIEESTTEVFDVYDVAGSGVSGIWTSFPCYETLVSV